MNTEKSAAPEILAADIVPIAEMAKDINAKYEEGMGFAAKATECMMMAGAILLDARERFRGDLEFGKWRKKNIKFSSSHVSRLMAVAREFSGTPDAALLPMSTLAELLTASEDLKDEIISKAKTGEKPTVKEVRSKVKEEKTPPEAMEKPSPASEPDPASKRPEPEKTAPPAPRAALENATDPIERISEQILEPFDFRLKQEDPFVVLGLTPMFDGTYNPEIINLIWEHYNSQDLNPGQQKKLDKAFANVKHQLFSENK